MTWYWWQHLFGVGQFPFSEILAVKGRKLFCKANVLPFLSGIEKRKCKNEKLLHGKSTAWNWIFVSKASKSLYTWVDITESASA